MEKLYRIINQLIIKRFTGRIEINFNNGGIRGIKKITEIIL
jgi:hypothetical protein